MQRYGGILKSVSLTPGWSAPGGANGCAAPRGDAAKIADATRPAAAILNRRVRVSDMPQPDAICLNDRTAFRTNW
jgi:hypothetical protein